MNLWATLIIQRRTHIQKSVKVLSAQTFITQSSNTNYQYLDNDCANLTISNQYTIVTMYHESEGQKNQVSNQINDSDCRIDQNFNGKKPNPALQNRLPQFLHQLDRETMSLIQEYLEKNKQKNAKKKKADRKIILYEDLTWITQFKKRQEELVGNKKTQATQEILKSLSGFRSLVTIKERVQKMLSKLTVQQIKHHIQRNEDFCFDSKKNLVVFPRLGEAKNVQKEQKQQRYYKKETNSNEIFQQDELPQKVQKPKPTSYVRKEQMEIEEKAKQSLEYKLERLSVATDNFNMQPPKKTYGRVINNEKSKQDITQAIVCVFNLENKTIKCFKRMEETKAEKNQTIKTGEFLSQIKQTKDKYETTPVKFEGCQQQLQQESTSSKKQATLSSGQTQKSAKRYAEVLEKNKQYQQTFGKMISTSINNEQNEIGQSQQFREINNPSTGTMGSEIKQSLKNFNSKLQQAQKQNIQINSNSEAELQTLRYQLSNNEQYMKMVNEDPKLSNRYIFCQQEDQALIKFNENTQQQLLTIKCLLRYKTLDIIQERLRFLNVPISQGFYAAVQQIIGQNSTSNNY